MEQMTFLDFFAGIGGFRKGFELCGMRCVGHCEIDKYADRSYRAIHDVKEDEWYAADITKVAPADLPRADLWAAGFPCQDISVAGRQRGLDGARSGLFFTLAGLIKGQSPENRPTWIVLENVKNLLSIHGGWDFATVLDTLASLGYHIEYGLLNTKYFGPPQNRERVFIVACRHPGAERRPKIFPVPAGRGKALIQLIGGMQGQRVYDPAGVSVTMAAQSGGWGGKTGLYFVDLCNGNPKLTDHARCIKAKYNSGITNRGGDNSGVLVSPAGMDKDTVLSFVDICTGKAKLTKEARCILSAYNRTISNWGGSSGVFYGCRAVVTPDREEKRQNGRRIKNCGEPSFTVTAQDRHGVLFQDCNECPYGMQIREATKKGYDIARCGDSINLSFPESKTRRGRVGKSIATTLETSCNQGTAFAGCGLIRRLTPRECWRLQGFTDEMFEKAQAVNSDNQLYRQAGNSVTVPVIYAIGKQMLILTGKGGKFAAVCAFSLFLAAMGAVICIVIQNYFMLPVLAAGMGLLPFWYVLFTSHSYKKLMNNEIETGLSIITSSYLRSESMITAVEENIHYLNPPVADVFRGFLAETNMISADVKQALSNMKPKLDNYVFREWVDAAIACQDDKSLKSTLTPIIGKLSDMRIVAAELDYLLYEPFKEFITMAFLLIGNIPLLYFLNKDWYDVLVHTGFGKGILAVCLLVLLISFAAVIRLTKPVEYKR